MSLSWLIHNFIAFFLLPPLNGLAMVGVGGLLLRRRRRLGKALIIGGFLLLTLLSLHVVARALLAPLERRHPPLDLSRLESVRADAVVVLGGGRNRHAPEFGGEDEVIDDALARLRYGALLARQMQKPVLVTGGTPDGGGRPEAEAMAISMQRDFGVKVRWVEPSSDNTRENALHSAELLKGEPVKRIVLVTHAWHMPRSVRSFEAVGFEVVPAPLSYLTARPLTPFDFMPRVGALNDSSRALHEWIGLLWYRLRG